jgi:teichoic acid glycerol-phosphate primase
VRGITANYPNDCVYIRKSRYLDMIRELLISIYLCWARLLFGFFRLFPLQKKSTFLSYMGKDCEPVVAKLSHYSDEKIVVVRSRACKGNFHSDNPMTLLRQDNPFHLFRCFYHLATSTHVFIENYHGFLAATDFKEGVRCIQLWHAAGAVKRFGLEDSSVKHRGERALKRFRKVYDRFDYVVAGSDKMSEIFQKSFGLPDDKVLKTGVVRTDSFFKETTERTHPKGKKVILYAPTYRDGQMKPDGFPFSVESLYQSLKDEYVILYKPHPLVNVQIDEKYQEFIRHASSTPGINNLFPYTDLLITDYSSIPFEFSFWNKPMIFYAYDLDEYIQTRGLWENYHSFVPGPVAQTTEELIGFIREQDHDMSRIQAFKDRWNHYSDGHSTERLLDFLYKNEQKKSP